MVLQIALATIQGTVDRLTGVAGQAYDWAELAVSFNPEQGCYEAYIQTVVAGPPKGFRASFASPIGSGASFELAIVSLAAELSTL